MNTELRNEALDVLEDLGYRGKEREVWNDLNGILDDLGEKADKLSDIYNIRKREALLLIAYALTNKVED